jgi:hypothetical protein
MSVSSGSPTDSTQVYSVYSYYDASAFPSGTPYTYLCLLNSFRVAQQFTTGTKFSVGLVTTSQANGTVAVRFYTAYGGSLTWIQWVWIIFANNDATVTPNIYARLVNQTYPGGIGMVELNVTGMNMYPTGYNRKCMIGQLRIEIDRDK